MSDETKLYAWVDLETTGTNEQIDYILELACIITAEDLEPIHSFHRVIKPATPLWYKRLEENEYVYNMHADSGLLEEIANQSDNDENVSIFEFCDFLSSVLTHFDKELEPPEFILAGSGVSHFDKRFLECWMGTRYNSFFKYHVLDIGVVRRFMRDIMGITDPMKIENQNKSHRAMEDIQLHLNEARAWRDLLDQNLNLLLGENDVSNLPN